MSARPRGWHARLQHGRDAGPRREEVHLLLETVPLDLRERARALRGAQGRREARARRRGAREPDRARHAVLRALLPDLGQGRLWRRLPVAAEGVNTIVPPFGVLASDAIPGVVLT